ncbi:GSCFA domain-containing protein [Psychrosphaera haliotis]|uniref:GSCFA domain-containing protein n=1 Tax=Psychrosphaera haliotis TaxID=555083 RepID=UPI002EDBA191
MFCAVWQFIYSSSIIAISKRAIGEFQPLESVWEHEDGSFRDPFRPNIQANGFVSEHEVNLDRQQHLNSVKKMFESLDVFVFTLGLTECWRAKADGAVFPLCPGVEGGDFDENKYEFYNQTVSDVIADMTEFNSILQRLNPTSQVILTVSPVPLMATASENQHVLSATTYSKSVLRVAAEELSKMDNIHYFPSYEVITGNYNRGSYYADDLRNVLEDGVSHVMGLFFKHATEGGFSGVPLEEKVEEVAEDKSIKAARELVEVECDEELLGR